jgi:hypothetical protein
LIVALAPRACALDGGGIVSGSREARPRFGSVGPQLRP